jgi:hypothetical protein
MPQDPFQRFAGLCAILTGVAGFLYAIAFIILRSDLLSGLFLLTGGILATAVFVALYHRLLDAGGFALWALLLGVVGSFGSAIHGGYNLAIAPDLPTLALPALPNAIDPRGLLTFGLTGLAIFIVSWLMSVHPETVEGPPRFPLNLARLGYVLATLLIVLYLGRLIIVESTSPIIALPALIAGFLVNPAWYIWLGLTLWKTTRS